MCVYISVHVYLVFCVQGPRLTLIENAKCGLDL